MGLGKIAFLALLLAQVVAVGPTRADEPVGRAPSALPGVVNNDARFGIDFVGGVSADTNVPYGDATTRYEWAQMAGARGTRWPFYWHNVERSPGVFDFAAQDAVVDADLRAGFQVNAILIGTPKWAPNTLALAAPVPSSTPIPGRPSLNLRLLGDDVTVAPPGLDAWPLLPDGRFDQQTPNIWARFVYQTVLRYKDWGKRWDRPDVGVKVWELWNEPDFPLFWKSGPERYFQLLRTGYVAVKAADPSATVLFGGLAYFTNPEFHRQVFDYIAADPWASARGYYFDALPVHLYVNPRNIWYIPGDIRVQMARRGFVKPIWVNEAGIGVCEDVVNPTRWCDNHGRGTLDQQADYVLQAFALAAAAGVERLFYFQLYDDGNAEEWFGLLRGPAGIPAGVPPDRPSFTAYQVAATYLGGATAATRSLPGSAEHVSLTGSPLGKVTAVWNWGKSPITTTVPATAARAKLVDPLGASQVVTATNGVHSIPLAAATHIDCVNFARQCEDPREREGVPVDLGSRPRLLVETVVSFDGLVTGNRGYGIANATVTLRNLTTGEITTARSNAGGGYRVEAYDFGSYEVSATAPGFGTVPPRAAMRDRAGSFPQTIVLPPLGNPIVDGGFEGGIGPSWQVTTTGTMTVTLNGIYVHSGGQALKLGDSYATGEAILAQTGITLPVGTRHPTVSLIYSTLGEPVDGERLTLQILADAGPPIERELSLRTFGWTLAWVPLDPATTGLSLRLTYTKPAASLARVFIDELAVGASPKDMRPAVFFPVVRR